MQKEIVALVAVKGTSERIKKKNTRPFHNTNLLELKLSQLKKVKGFHEIIVSSEDSGILETARKKGVNVHIRDPKYSTSFLPPSELFSYIASEISGEHIAWVNVTNPLFESNAYDKAIEAYNNLDSKYNCLTSVYEVKNNLFYKGRPINFQANPWPRSQDLEGVCAMSHAINIMRREEMIPLGSYLGSSPYFFYMDSISSLDIDYQIDFDFCEMIYKKRHS
ncbi:MAG TPA: hypothetical protein QF468_14340 [Nitrospinota bacterium]|jgi:N-acylneuraminate cytidylyltransferase|nr:hypothetical protein [Nitrospinota bacterium]|tara:strand:- start:24530 stop:25192 length:663 start_codon:yes stop_codon:yes gene_type:complete